MKPSFFYIWEKRYFKYSDLQCAIKWSHYIMKLSTQTHTRTHYAIYTVTHINAYFASYLGFIAIGNHECGMLCTTPRVDNHCHSIKCSKWELSFISLFKLCSWKHQLAVFQANWGAESMYLVIPRYYMLVLSNHT